MRSYILHTTWLLALGGGCTADTQLSTTDSTLTAEQCSYAAVDGKVTVCHASTSIHHPYTILTTTVDACTRHTSHVDDYVAIGDPSCSGGGCLPAGAPCDATLPCCDGSSCSAGTCVPDQTAAPLLATFVSSLVTDTGGGAYANWIGAWSGVTAATSGDRLGYLLPGDEPNSPTIENQWYAAEMTASTPSVLAIGPNNSGDVPAQILTVTSDTGTLAVYMPSIIPNDCVRTRFYVGADGSTYHSRADHDYTWTRARENIFTEQCYDHMGVVGPDLTPAQAMVPQHLARAAQP